MNNEEEEDVTGPAPVAQYDADGSLLMWQTPNAAARLHLDVHACPVTQRMAEEGVDLADRFTPVVVPDLRAVAVSGVTRPCRKCALEHTAVTVLTGSGTDRVPHEAARSTWPRVFATFTSQPSVGEAFTRRLRRASGYTFEGTSPSAAARLRRICQRVGLPTVATSAGPAAYGFVPSDAVEFLARNFRLEVRASVLDLPDASVVTTAWGLWNMRPPQVDAAAEGVFHANLADLVTGSSGSPRDAWFQAELVCAQVAR